MSARLALPFSKTFIIGRVSAISCLKADRRGPQIPPEHAAVIAHLKSEADNSLGSGLRRARRQEAHRKAE